jgi:hypothetical protein
MSSHIGLICISSFLYSINLYRLYFEYWGKTTTVSFTKFLGLVCLFSIFYRTYSVYIIFLRVLTDFPSPFLDIFVEFCILLAGLGLNFMKIKVLIKMALKKRVVAYEVGKYYYFWDKREGARKSENLNF